MQAFAKLNLALHVTGQRADGYHLLDSLVAFVDIGDELYLELGAGTAFDLAVSGPFARALASTAPEDNLVLRALEGVRLLAADKRGGKVRLVKNLPVASGIGGGSADAAAALRLAAEACGLDLHAPETAALALSLGADVPMCMESRPLRAEGIGERLTLLPAMPEAGVLLVNPGVSVSTPQIFGHLTDKTNPPQPPIPAFATAKDLARFIGQTRNDLQPAAIALQPVIGDVLAELAETKALACRMSGSGATCFAIFETVGDAKTAEMRLSAAHENWWVKAGRFTAHG